MFFKLLLPHPTSSQFHPLDSPRLSSSEEWQITLSAFIASFLTIYPVKDLERHDSDRGAIMEVRKASILYVIFLKCFNWSDICST